MNDQTYPDEPQSASPIMDAAPLPPVSSISLENQRASEEDRLSRTFDQFIQETMQDMPEEVIGELNIPILPGEAVQPLTEELLIVCNDPKYKEPVPVDTIPKLTVKAEPENTSSKRHYRLVLNQAAMNLLQLHTGSISGDSVGFSFIRQIPYIVRIPVEHENRLMKIHHIRGGGVFADKLLNMQLRMMASATPIQEVIFVLETQPFEGIFPVVAKLVKQDS